MNSNQKETVGRLNTISPRVHVVIRKKSTGGIRRRVVDEEGFIRRVASVCVNEDETQILLITSKKDSSAWLIPGGGIEKTEQDYDAVRREAWEEAGVKGHIGRRLGIFETTHPSGSKKHRTTVYVYSVSQQEDDFPEACLGRKRAWFSVDEALLLLSSHRPLQSVYLKFLTHKNDANDEND